MATNIRCVIVDDEPIAREILTSFIEKTPTLKLIASCKNATEAIHFIQENEVDLFFLDINMPEITGLSLAKIIGNKSKIIFTTAYRDYAVDGFNLNVVDYLLKPIAFDRFFEAIKKIPNTSITNNTEPQKQETKNFMFVRSNRKMIKVNFTDISYIESLGDYIKIITAKNTITTRETITNIEEKLNNTFFLRIHRSFIINFHEISSYTNEYIEINKKALPISRSYKEAVLQKLADV